MFGFNCKCGCCVVFNALLKLTLAIVYAVNLLEHTLVLCYSCVERVNAYSSSVTGILYYVPEFKG